MRWFNRRNRSLKQHRYPIDAGKTGHLYPSDGLKGRWVGTSFNLEMTEMKKRISKILFAFFWLAAGVGLLFLLAAAIRSQKSKICSGYAIEIDGIGDQWFVSKQEIADLLRVDGVIKGRSLRRFNLEEMETSLKKNPWIANADLFFDNNQVLQVRIKEHVPIARVFTVGGASFYLDNDGDRLPLSNRFSAKLPVFTGFPEVSRKTDSAMTAQTVEMGEYILENPFWMAQIAQVNITGGNFELIPVVGDHVIEFGDGTRCPEKFNKLMTFYKMVLSKIGMNYYKTINVQYRKQVLGIRNQKPEIRNQ